MTEEDVRRIASEAAGHAITTIVNARTTGTYNALLSQIEYLRRELSETRKGQDEILRIFNANILAMDARVQHLERQDSPLLPIPEYEPVPPSV